MTKQTDNMPVRTRRQAAEAGLRTYWNGHACAKGHESVRYTASGSCSACAKGYYQTAAAVRSSRIATRRGLVGFRVFAHAADQAAIEAFAAALVTARDLDGPTAIPAARLPQDAAARAAWLDGERNRIIARGVPADGRDIVPALPDGAVVLEDTLEALRPPDLSRC